MLGQDLGAPRSCPSFPPSAILLPPVNYKQILDALADLTSRARVESSTSAPSPVSPYPPIEKYFHDLHGNAKPGTAAEDLFDDYYDTEIFSTRILGRLDRTPTT